MKKEEWKGIWTEGWATFKDILRCGAVPGCLLMAVGLPVAVLIVAALFGLLALLAGCRSVQHVPVETVREARDSVAVRDSIVYRSETRWTDSVRVKDSTVIVQDAEGNILREKYYRTEERYSLLRAGYEKLAQAYERLKAQRADSVQVPVPVEKPLTRWQQFRLDVGGYAIFAVIGAAAFLTGRWLRWRRK